MKKLFTSLQQKHIRFVTHPLWWLHIGTIWKILRDWDDGKLHATEEVEMIHAEINRNHIRAEFQHPYAVKLMAMSFCDTLDKCPGANNYVEIHMESKKHGPLLVTVQRKLGKTPHELKSLAMVEAEQAKGERNRAALEERKKYIPKLEQLRSLIKHIDIHSAYRCCGYQQMTTEQKQLFREITGGNDGELMAICTR